MNTQLKSFRHTLLPLFLLICFLKQSYAQNNDFIFGMGIPDSFDHAYEKLPVKARQTDAIYRNSGSAASLLKYAPTPASQGSYGTCAAWAAGFCARTILEAQRQGWTDKNVIDKHVFSYGFLYRAASSRSDCNGAYLSDCVSKLNEVGVPKLFDFSEHCPSYLPGSSYTAAAAYKIDGYATLWNMNYTATDKQKIQLIKKSIDAGNPVVISMFVPLSFCYSKGPIWYPRSTDIAQGVQGHQHGRHAMCVVAYDDNSSTILLQNSWGTGWGNQGYMKIRYQDAVRFIYQAIELYKLKPFIRQEQIRLSGSLTLEDFSGQPMEAVLTTDHVFKMKKAYRSGTRFRIYLNNQQAAYVYAIGSDLTNAVYSVFPFAGVSPYLNYRSNKVPIPSASKHIRMDGTIGTDFLCVLYSKHPLDIENIKQAIRSKPGHYNFKERVEAVLASKLVAANKHNYYASPEGFFFDYKGMDQSVAALFVEIEHID